MKFNINNFSNMQMNMNMNMFNTNFNPNFMQLNPNTNMNMSQNLSFNNRNMNIMKQNPMAFSCNIRNMNSMNNKFRNDFGNINRNNRINNNPQNNMANNNFNNSNIINTQNNQNLKMRLFQNSLALKDPYKIQLNIALGLNNNQQYEHYVQGGNQVPDFMKQSSNENSVGFGVNDDKINVVFVVMKGNVHTRIFSENEKIKDMLSKFLKSVGLHEYHLDNIYFLFNAVNLNTINKEQTLKQFGIKNTSKITVIDIKDIIGA